MNWFNSTNAKEIGTLYFILAVFAGMLGTAFSVLVRQWEKEAAEAPFFVDKC
jgi:heme/copper-type cytochrome/quinol oxidase subunit 1